MTKNTGHLAGDLVEKAVTLLRSIVRRVRNLHRHLSDQIQFFTYDGQAPAKNARFLEMKKTYTARCHCGEIHFSFDCEEITEGRRCNCSLCIRRGAVMSAKYIPAADFRPHQNQEQLNGYQWNDRVVDALFCKTCGIFPYFGNGEFGYRVNLGCVEQLDALSLKIEILDGRSMPLADNPGPHPSAR